MGSSSDLETMAPAAMLLEKFGVEYEIAVVSAHRSPEMMLEYAKTLDDRGINVLIAGAGGAAHLPGMIAAVTTIPVIGVPVKSKKSLDGWDSLLSIVQMPDDVPVATMALNNAHNAALLAVQILAISNPSLKEKLLHMKEENLQKVKEQNATLMAKLQSLRANS